MSIHHISLCGFIGFEWKKDFRIKDAFLKGSMGFNMTRKRVSRPQILLNDSRQIRSPKLLLQSSFLNPLRNFFSVAYFFHTHSNVRLFQKGWNIETFHVAGILINYYSTGFLLPFQFSPVIKAFDNTEFLWPHTSKSPLEQNVFWLNQKSLFSVKTCMCWQLSFDFPSGNL